MILDLPNCPKKPIWSVGGYFHKPPPVVLVVQLHLANHMKRLPSQPFTPVKASPDGVYDFGKRGWYCKAALPHNKSIPWRGALDFMLNQHLGYAHSVRRALTALKSIGRITPAQYTEFVGWLDAERKSYDTRDDLPNAVILLAQHGLKVAVPRAASARKLLAETVKRANVLKDIQKVKAARRASSSARHGAKPRATPSTP